ncbi:kinase-like domain-containing protein [Aspergillus varians]
MMLRPANFLKGLRQRPWALSSAIPPRIVPSSLVEEENSPYYNPAYFYPARIGEVLNGRYQIATKLGHGSRSTVWLARDLHQWRWSDEKYVTVKINCHNNARTTPSEAELDIMRLITKTNPHHEGWYFVRTLLDSFSLEGASGGHLCLVFDPLRESLGRYCRRWENGVMPPQIFKIVLQMVLHALDYLHSECRVVHTDLKPDNIMAKLEDRRLLHQDAQKEFENPLPQKHCPDGRTIYKSRRGYGPLKRITGTIEITDFDLAVPGDSLHDGCIQAEVYRAPEVILDLGYSYSADIWSLGVILWDFLEGKPLFESVDPPVVGEYDDQMHLAAITALLGPAPRECVLGGKRTSMFYTDEGILKSDTPMSNDFTFTSTLSKITGEEKKMFIDFVRRMVKWRPEERSTAKELLQDPWLYNDFSED